LRDGDVVRLDTLDGTLMALVPDFDSRPLATADLSANGWGIGREMFEAFRRNVGNSTEGAAVVV
jgi:phosphogluconate dehydratase